MKKLLLILLCLPMIGVGQGWERMFGGFGFDEGRSVQQTTDGGYIVAGITDMNFNAEPQVFLIKTDDNGIEQWSKTFGGINNDQGRSVQQTTDGGYIITGYQSSTQGGSYDVYLIKTNSQGDSIWTKTFGEIGYSAPGSGTLITAQDFGYSVQQTIDGGYIITGQMAVPDPTHVSQPDIFLIKTDSQGDSIWTKTFGGDGANTDYGRSVQQTTDGGYIITGGKYMYYSTTFNGSTDVSLIKTDANGLEQWSKTFGGIESDGGNSVQQTTDGGYIIAGWTTFQTSPGDHYSKIYIIKTDSQGDTIWTQILGDYSSIANSIQQTTDGGYIITGKYPFAFGGPGVYLLKIDGNGIEQWEQFIGDENGVGHSVQQTIDGGYIITGYQQDEVNEAEVYLVKTDGNGNVTSTFNILINPNRKLEKVVDILGRDIKPKTNTPFIEIYDDGTVEKRIIIE